ncbi:MAG: hypothetical protein NZ585_14180 [Chloracidobacterium sp.]|nr:hypothetical protein [Chloracidobacterium sp.]MDW8217867.1 hypothetical protein [Acidobacteriota bacterium]
MTAALERQASPGELYELESGEGEAETLEEIAATGGNQRRNVERSLESGAVAERRLKCDGPLPQSVYAAAVEADTVIVVPVWLRCRR